MYQNTSEAKLQTLTKAVVIENKETHLSKILFHFLMCFQADLCYISLCAKNYIDTYPILNTGTLTLVQKLLDLFTTFPISINFNNF